MNFVTMWRFRQKATKQMLAESVKLAEQLPREDIKILDNYWTLGSFDLITVAEAVEDEKQIHEIINKNRLSKSQLSIKYTTHPSIHYMIADRKEAMLSTMADAHGSESPYLWTNEENLVGILQTNFEQMWHSSSSVDSINEAS